MPKVVLVGGGTGGHLFPAISIAQELYKQNITTIIVTDDRCASYIPIDFALPVKVISLGSMKNSISGKLILAMRLAWATAINFAYMLFWRPVCVVSFGGYPTLPSLIAAFLLRVPIVLHEQNGVLGKVNRLFASHASLIGLNFANTLDLPERAKVRVVGNPVRMALSSELTRSSAEKLTILVIAGSQGADFFDKTLPKAITLLCKSFKTSIKVVEQARPENAEQIRAAFAELGVECEVRSFFSNIEELYKSADLVIARAGASTISELIAMARPAILVPIPNSIKNHQVINGRMLEQQGGCIVVEEAEASPESLSEVMYDLLRQDDRRAYMRQKLASLQRNSSQAFAEALLEQFPQISK